MYSFGKQLLHNADPAGLCLATPVLPHDHFWGIMDATLEFEAYLMCNRKSPMDFEIALTFLVLSLGPVLRGTVFGISKGYSWYNVVSTKVK